MEQASLQQNHSISIHALREEGDGCKRCHRLYGLQISIHALREEGDRETKAMLDAITHFYPRPPRGGRPLSSALTEIL